ELLFETGVSLADRRRNALLVQAPRTIDFGSQTRFQIAVLAAEPHGSFVVQLDLREQQPRVSTGTAVASLTGSLGGAVVNEVHRLSRARGGEVRQARGRMRAENLDRLVPLLPFRSLRAIVRIENGNDALVEQQGDAGRMTTGRKRRERRR